MAAQDNPFGRAVQSEIDRRAARANRLRDNQGRFVRQQRIEALQEQERQARRSDVYKAAEIRDQLDGLQQQEAFVRGVVENYDRVSIDPLIGALPEKDRASLLADLPDGLEGRAQLVRAALARLEQVWRSDERRKLRGGPAPASAPGANGGGRPRPARPVEEDDGEPEVSVAGRGRRAPATMNDWLRAQMHR